MRTAFCVLKMAALLPGIKESSEKGRVIIMKVSNKICIYKLSFKALWASRTRNIIAVLAIALTALMFTSLFTVALSINSSYETYNFRQIGGYNHGSFKEVNEEQIAAITAHPLIKESGQRRIVGFCSDNVFAKVPAEVSYMDANNSKWSYCIPTTGRMAQGGNEITMDTKALQLLGIKPELGAEIALTYEAGDQNQKGEVRTDIFTLVGFWDYDEIAPVHFINVSKEYAEQVTEELTADGLAPFRTDLNVMLASSVNIRGIMEQVDTDLGYQWENRGAENCVRIGVNWGYTSAQAGSRMDPGTIMSILAFMLLVIFTGYLIIYNIFQISVSGDIRFYGLLKTIGVTPRQLRRIIRQQALLLSAAGIPLGLLGGYGVGAVVTPFILDRLIMGSESATISASPLIFAGAAAFSLITVIISCTRPGRMAARVSPVEAAKYTENTQVKKKSRNTRGAKVYQMAFANLGRNRRKTVLVALSLSLSVVLLTVLYIFVGGFDMDKYLERNTSADFIVGSTEYFRYNGGSEDAALEPSVIEQIRQNTQQTLQGCAYFLSGYSPQCWISEAAWTEQMSSYYEGEMLNEHLNSQSRRAGQVGAALLVEGLDEELFEKLAVVEGDLAPLSEPDSNAIAICVSVDDYGNVRDEIHPEIGDTLTVTYVDEIDYLDSRTGGPAQEETPAEYLEGQIVKSHDVDYTVCALVNRPYSMGPRFSRRGGYDAVLPVSRLRADSNQDTHTLFYMFDTPDEHVEAQAESYVADITAGDLSGIMYESKKTVREEFDGFKNMFLLLGSLLCFIIGFVGILNFFNAIMTGILSRRREFAVLESIGMTRRQLTNMLVYEGILYAAGTVLLSFVLVIVMGPLTGRMIEDILWFFSYRFTIAPVLLAAPVFILLGWLIPLVIYRTSEKSSVVERLRQTE